MRVGIKKLDPRATIPTRGSGGAAGYDLYALIETEDEKILIEPKQKVLVRTGIAVEIPEGFTVEIYPRSGLSVKKGLRLCNCVGLIDEDYRGEFKVALYNDSDEVQEVQMGDRIAQMVFRKYYAPELFECNELSRTERAEGGFGSTGA